MVHHWRNTAWASASSLEPVTVTFYLSPGFELLALSAALEVLTLANRVAERPAFSWRVVSSLGDPVIASSGVSIGCSSALAVERAQLLGASRPQIVVVCGDETSLTRDVKALEAWIRECRKHRLPIAAFGSGVEAFARAGVLGRRRCAVHWEAQPAFAERFMNCDSTTTIYEEDDGVWTCAGGIAALDMMVRFIEKECGVSVATRVGELAVTGRIREGIERQRVPFLPRQGGINPTVLKLIELMEDNLVTLIAMSELAEAVDLSRRQIERLFRTEVGVSPRRYYKELRLERARLLLTQSDLPVVDIAVSCGFVSASHFSRCFRDVHKVAPMALRKTGSGVASLL